MAAGSRLLSSRSENVGGGDLEWLDMVDDGVEVNVRSSCCRRLATAASG